MLEVFLVFFVLVSKIKNRLPCSCSLTCLVWKEFTETNRRRLLVSSQKRKQLFVLLIRKSSTACHMFIVFIHRVGVGFRMSVLLGRRSRNTFSMPWRMRQSVGSSANHYAGVPSCPSSPAAPLCAAPPDLPVVCPGFKF